VLGYEQFLTEFPNWQGKIVLIQVAVPSREDVKEYQDLETQISCQVGKINGKFSTKRNKKKSSFLLLSDKRF
jgi:trehalose-6-phosphate synthase